MVNVCNCAEMVAQNTLLRSYRQPGTISLILTISTGVSLKRCSTGSLARFPAKRGWRMSASSNKSIIPQKEPQHDTTSSHYHRRREGHWQGHCAAAGGTTLSS